LIFNKITVCCFIGLLGCLVGCVPQPKNQPVPQPDEYRGVFILNEGTWTRNEARLDLLVRQDDYRAVPGIFEAVNGQPLGDVAHNFLLDADTLFLVINNSRRILKLQLPSLRLLAALTLPPSASPRTLVRTAPHEAWVSSLLDGTLYRIDPRDLSLRPPHIAVQPWPEDLLWAEGKLYVSCGNYVGSLGQRNRHVAVIDPAAGQALQYITLPVGNPGPLARHPDGRILVGCRGDYDTAGSAICILDPQTDRIDATIRLQGSLYDLLPVGHDLLINSDSAISHIDLRTGVLTYHFLSKSQLQVGAFELLYTLAFDPTRQELWVSNARAGATAGEVIALSWPGLQVLRRRPAGTFPGAIFFYD
jgi:streptogramin lyase